MRYIKDLAIKVRLIAVLIGILIVFIIFIFSAARTWGGRKNHTHRLA